MPENQRLQFVDSGLPATMRGDRLTYFSEAVFSGLDDTLRLFLIRSTIFDPVDPNSIARYLGDKPIEETEAMLTTLVRRNLFTHPLFEAQAGWGSPPRLGFPITHQRAIPIAIKDLLKLLISLPTIKGELLFGGRKCDRGCWPTPLNFQSDQPVQVNGSYAESIRSKCSTKQITFHS